MTPSKKVTDYYVLRERFPLKESLYSADKFRRQSTDMKHQYLVTRCLNTLTAPAAMVAMALVWASGCASTGIRIESQFDGTEVFLIRAGKGDPVKIGQTPFVLAPNLIQDSGTNGAIIRLSREGYRTETVTIPKISSQSFGVIRVELLRDQNACTEAMGQMNDITRQINTIVKLTSRRKLSEAESLAVEIASKYPEIAIVHDLLGNIHYLNHKPQSALDSYQRSLQLNPRNVETQRMIEKLSAMGSRGRD